MKEKLLRLPAIFLLAVFVNTFVFLLVPLIQVLFGKIDFEKRQGPDRNLRQVAVHMPDQKKQKQREIRELKPLMRRMESRPTPIARNLNIDLSVEGASRVSVAGGGSGSGIGGSQGLGQVVYNPGETDTDAKIIGSPPDPRPPMRAEREDVDGEVELAFVVDERGFVQQIRILREDPKGYGFAREATQYVKRLRFKPASLQNVPVPQNVRIPIRFEVN